MATRCFLEKRGGLPASWSSATSASLRCVISASSCHGSIQLPIFQITTLITPHRLPYPPALLRSRPDARGPGYVRPALSRRGA